MASNNVERIFSNFTALWLDQQSDLLPTSYACTFRPTRAMNKRSARCPRDSLIAF